MCWLAGQSVLEFHSFLHLFMICLLNLHVWVVRFGHSRKGLRDIALHF